MREYTHNDYRLRDRQQVTNSMQGTIRLGYIGKTSIDAHITFTPVLLWAAWLGWAQYGGVAGALFGVTAILLLFGCVLAHELAHSLYAGTYGINVEYIILLPIGGLTSLDTSSLKPHDEARIALIGPLMNLAVGLILGLIISAVALSHRLDLATAVLLGLQHPSALGVLAYLAAANLMLAAFNLLPAFPLDGGRALRAILSTRMPFDEATHRAAIAGRSFGAGLIAMGGTLLLFGSIYYGTALVIVGATLYVGATHEDHVVQRHTALNTWTVEHVLHAAPFTAAPNQSLSSAISSVARGQVVPVVMENDPTRIVGLLTTHELKDLNGTVEQLNVAHVMRTRYPSVRASDPLWVAYEKLLRSRLVAIPVVSQNIYSGLVTVSDIRWALKQGDPPAKVVE